MNRNPSHRVDPPQATPEGPREMGRRLASIPRVKRNAPDEELRISLDEYEGHPYVSVRLFARDTRSGEWFPTRKGCSVRIAECEAVASALRKAVGIVESERPARPAPRPPGGPLPPDRSQWGNLSSGPSGNGSGADFDEF